MKKLLFLGLITLSIISCKKDDVKINSANKYVGDYFIKDTIINPAWLYGLKLVLVDSTSNNFKIETFMGTGSILSCYLIDNNNYKIDDQQFPNNGWANGYGQISSNRIYLHVHQWSDDNGVITNYDDINLYFDKE